MAKREFDPLKPNPDDPQGLPFRRLPNGQSNLEYYREAYALVTRDAMRCLANDIKPATDPKSLADLILKEAKLCGHSENDVVDRRSKEDILKDGFATLLSTPEGFFEITDEMLDHLESEAQRCVEMCQSVINEKNSGEFLSKDEAPDLVKSVEKFDLGKAMLSRIRRVIRLRDSAKNPVPKYLPKLTTVKQAAWEASHLLRYMLYVGRANNTMLKDVPEATKKLFRFGLMHAKMAVCLWEAEHGIKFNIIGIHWNARRVGGAILNAPPGHGKSELAMHHASLWISKRPMTQGVYLHEVEDIAKKSVAYIKSTFDPATDRGRRNIALFPKVRLAKRGNDAKQMQVETGQKTKSPTLTAAGVMSGRQGANTDYQIRDDIVPQTDAHEETTRNRRKEIISGTWDRRQRGNNPFTLNIGTLWHVSDALATMVKQARAGKGAYDLCVIKTGGPKTEPQFYAAWPEVYDEGYLRREYERMNNPNLWSAAFMGNPKADETRIISSVRLYDRTSEQHAEFLRSATMHLSIDPAATNREKNDKAALFYAGIGEVNDIDPVAKTERGVLKFRVVDATQMHNTPGELMESLAGYCQSRRVDHLHIETKTGFAALGDWVDSEFGIECIRHDPGDKSKERRLRQCAGLICRRINEAGGFEAVVEFPGIPKLDKSGNPVLKDGCKVIVPDPQYEWLIEQFVDFGNAEDHALDAGTQLINWASRNGYLPASGGLVTRKIMEHEDEVLTDAKRIKAAFQKAAKPRSVGTIEDRLADFFSVEQEREPSWN